ncbi:hypothetical protein LNV23_16425 [Paucibacter sp. DJ1R-11]|uniref:hypothetical protein n=1 Tax=Paucibacter sp. DJ1R-11 TaxID=2893556 RepID=UPI0021E469B5|nr:hypothetical protein [Paucibacter sp. DJ1R-11]MCV2365039.1 hypothetical protein [Paucibacter sp. DJ1R-11]
MKATPAHTAAPSWRLLAMLSLLLWLLPPGQADAAEAMLELPPGFALAPLQKTVTVVYAQSTGELFNSLNKTTLEASCQAALAVGAATRMPRFAPGSEAPLQFELRRYTSLDGQLSASYSDKEHVECAEANLKTEGPCACLYRKARVHSVYLERREAHSVRRWQVALESRSGRRSSGPAGGAEPLAAPSAQALQTLHGGVIGTRELAGYRCQLRRADRGSSRVETCLLLPTADLPTALQGRQLAQTVFELQAGQSGRRLRWLDTRQLLPRAQIDAVVFEPLSGIAYQERPISAGGEQP